jgi:nucleoside-diphosphate-sugar epimerase
MQANAARDELRLLLIGATGNVGQHCLQRLLEDAMESGEPVKILVATRDPEGFWSTYRHPRRCPAVVEPVKCDAGDPLSLAAVIAATAPTRIFIAMAQARQYAERPSCLTPCQFLTRER